jgi:hypothetical protein
MNFHNRLLERFYTVSTIKLELLPVSNIIHISHFHYIQYYIY